MDDRSATTTWPADVGPSTAWPIYTRGNIGEVYPEVVLPLEADLAWEAAERGWRVGAASIGFAVPEDFGDEPHVVMGVFGGYAYFNVSLMRLLGVRTPRMGPELIDDQFLGDADVPAYRPRKGDRRPAATLKVVRTAVQTMRARQVPLLGEMRSRADAVRHRFPGKSADDAALWNYIRDSMAADTEYFIASHVINTMRATIAAGALADFCEKHLGDPNLALELTTGIGDVASAEPAHHMWRLANETSAEDFDAAFADFLRRHGHRGPNEFSLHGRDWAAFPELAVTAIDTMRGLDPEHSPANRRTRMAADRDAAVRSARERLNGRTARRLDSLIDAVSLWSRAREESKDIVVWANQLGRHAFLELVRRAAARGGTEDRTSVLLLTAAEFEDYLADPPSMLPTIAARRADHAHLSALEPPFAFDSSDFPGGHPSVDTWRARSTALSAVAPATTGATLHGAAGAPGTATGPARVVRDPGEVSDFEPGDVLVAPLTDPSWTPLFVGASAVVVEIGAAMSHSMIVSRELGIPCVVGVDNATHRLRSGSIVEVDGSAGVVRVIEAGGEA